MADYDEMMKRQQALADFGEFAIRSQDLDEVLMEACRLIGEATGTGRAKVLEIQEGGQELFLRAGVGWGPDVVGRVRLQMNERSSETYSIRFGQPVCSQDIAKEERFEVPTFMKEAGVVAFVNVPIFVPGERPYGILQIDDTEPREFGDDEIQFLRTYATILGPVIDRLHLVEERRAMRKRMFADLDAANESFTVSFADIEQRKEAEMEFLRIISLLRTTFDNSHQIIQLFRAIRDEHDAIVDFEWVLTNKQWNDRWGPMTGKRLLKQNPAVVESGVWDRFIQVMETGEPIMHEHYYKHEQFDGWFSQTIAKAGDGILLSSLDITEQRRTEEALSESEANYRMLFDSIDQGFCIIEVLFDVDDVPIDYRFLECNVSFERQTGMKDAAGKRMRALQPAHEQHWFDIYGEIALTGEPRRFEARADALGRWYSVYAFRVDEPEQRRVAILFDDVSDRMRAEAALRESEERLRQFGEASQDVLWIRDAEAMQWTYLTPGFETIYGVSREEALTGDNFRSWLEMVVPEDRRRAIENIRRVRRGEHVTFEYRIRRPLDGEIRWLRNTDFPIVGDDGVVNFIGGIGSDITDEKLTQALLERSEERLQSAIEVGRLGLWDWNVLTGDVHWSDEHFRMEGYAVGEVTPSYEAWAARIHADDRPGAEAALRQAQEAREEFDHEFRTVHPDGSVHWLHGRGRFFFDETGRAVRMVGAMTDTTARREWEERQAVLVAELQHRTRNLMGVVRSMAEKTAESSADLPDFRDRFQDRLESLARVQGLLSRLNEHDRVTFDDLIRTELDAMGGRADRVTLSGPAGIRLRSSTVQMLAMALHELATNAVKYGALGPVGGRLTVSWTCAPSGADGKPWLQVDWRESGVVIPSPTTAPRGSGQGRELIERALPYQLRAKTTFEITPTGVHCTLAIPISESAVAPEAS